MWELWLLPYNKEIKGGAPESIQTSISLNERKNDGTGGCQPHHLMRSLHCKGKKTLSLLLQDWFGDMQ